ncbi:hypothetical protein BDY19DRAFT_990939 [Irpex rosettiformis]|uniref:Uncharacterized protein n=1 Tax=Irpex rosettiformis TaxID=378272 RepID=A0ACB8UCY0_9APHY|nr:hypothetical protein BDY19DRAFT_990939 [Irpex rosettiformis]
MPQFGFSNFVWDQYTKLPPVLTSDLKGKSVIVTGANTGIGLEVAKHFARMGPARLIIACRNESKAKAAAEEIAKSTSHSAEVQLLDLSGFESVVSFAKRLVDEPIDILVANAAVALGEYVATTDGWEQTIQVNHLSTALLSFLLVPNLVKASKLHDSCSRLVVVSSEVHCWASFDDELMNTNILATLSDKEYCTPERMAHHYEASKLLNVLFTRAFSHHLSPSYSSSLIPDVVNPGLCVSELARNAPLAFKIRIKILHTLFARTAEQGARQVVWAALGPDGKDGPHVQQTMGGEYVSIAQIRQPSDFVVSRTGWEAQEKIWNETIDILSNVEPSVRTIVAEYFNN